ncbi:hypothetical protein WJX81_004941 [Elliptochloris bilobata]|uniref:Very-long-chain 3-oxoacyl-CoA synthase n=1 Tax=Elliptochloris bilobata TaxID=381761 RepID=A0AAW1RYM4_9CHLO
MAAAKALADYLVGPGYFDERVSAWPLLDWRVAAAMSGFYLLSIPVGQQLMRGRQPFKLRRFAAVHNAILFSLSLYMTIEVARQAYRNFGWQHGLRLWCNQNERGPFSDSGYKLARVLWVHYASKAYEFVDTWIMILKKNNRQISVLHVYHHASTFFPVWWAVISFGPGGEAWFCAFLNSLIHVFMYGYYLAASLGLRAAAVKPLITQAQMGQFLLFISQSVYILFVRACYRPRLSPLLLLVQCVIFFALFAEFYRRTYLRKPARQAVGKREKPEDATSLLQKALSSAAGFSVGDVLGQRITGDTWNPLRSLELGAFGFLIDGPLRHMLSQISPENGAVEMAGKVKHSVSSALDGKAWVPMLACVAIAALKAADGDPAALVHSCEDKVVSLLLSNYLLWPVTNHIMSKFVPKQHRAGATHVVTMVWSAWLSTMGHAPTDLLDQAGTDMAEAVSNAVSDPASSPFGAPAFAHAAAAAGAAVSSAAAPALERAGEAVQGMAALAERLPSSLLEKALSKSLDVLSPLHAHERSPSQLLDDLLSVKPSGALDSLLERSGTLRLPMVLEG